MRRARVDSAWSINNNRECNNINRFFLLAQSQQLLYIGDHQKSNSFLSGTREVKTVRGRRVCKEVSIWARSVHVYSASIIIKL